jgi:RNA polymerase sigma factor (sigma-70 family)
VATSAHEASPFREPSRPSPGAARSLTENLFATYSRTVVGLCRALLRDRVEAEDAAQQVFLSAHRALLNGSTPREPAAWLATIARNECWARIGARMREPLPSADAEPHSRLPDPLAEAIRKADLTALWRAIDELPPQQRRALLLREFGGLSYDELAAALAVSTPAVESLLFRARTGLRARLRTAYASVTGASWLEGLLRLAAGGSSVAVPVAAKVVAVGVGAAVVTGGTVALVPHRVGTARSRPVVQVPQQRLAVVATVRPLPGTSPIASRSSGEDVSDHSGDRTEQAAATMDGGKESRSSDGGHDAASTPTTASSGDRRDASTSGDGGSGSTATATTTATIDQADGGESQVTTVTTGGDGLSGDGGE